MKVLRNIWILAILSFLFVWNCRSYEVRLKDGIDEAKVEKFQVPRKNRFPFFHDEEDLTVLCGKGELVFVKFTRNIPREIWCEGMVPESKPSSSTLENPKPNP
ncbi:hypothetical protein EHQ27_04235 [Leptospira wolffii]|uniref:hypothetical protein n=1 Tax=Leptospira wolffii TaxID=409998 RepID=UPI001083B2D9|nr:hypothetical protein [Leptospira wolffii]TGK61719.1 hypothetical protein EHQ32_02365 [Leptospira wolffii]TGK70262.1 hypothetical protein EHQ35_17780 [Leptospira wolffii]TGK77185.1 hypothetical protein EHQ27_04235 [Leptospira wolffii]TGL30962.1 hypothetical protein EHQ57_06030 [Leptospira wolffii]